MPPPGTSLTDDALRSLLERAASNPSYADHFFARLNYVAELLNGNHSTALRLGIALLERCHRLSHQDYTQIHKGTPFYWIATAAFLVHDYQTAVFFYDAAASEDIRAGADPTTKPTPALRFLQVQGDQPDQAAQALVKTMQSLIERAIMDYNSRPGLPPGIGTLQLSDIREKFLRRALCPGGEHLRTLATAFISFFLEWEYRRVLIGLRIGEGTIEPFFLHLFKGCLLFESILKANPKTPPATGGTLGSVLQHLQSDLAIPRNLSIGRVTFPTILASLPPSDNSVITAIEFTGRIRNTVGHDMGWRASLDQSMYDSLTSMVASSCLHAITCLYR
jgi:hypothetical protein